MISTHVHSMDDFTVKGEAARTARLVLHVTGSGVITSRLQTCLPLPLAPGKDAGGVDGVVPVRVEAEAALEAVIAHDLVG